MCLDSCETFDKTCENDCFVQYHYETRVSFYIHESATHKYVTLVLSLYGLLPEWMPLRRIRL